MHISKYKANAGYTIVELVISVTVAGVISTGVLTIGSYVWAEQKAEDFGKRLEYLIGAVEDFFNSRTNYEQLSLTTAVQLGFLQYEKFVPPTIGPAGVVTPATATHIYNRPMSLGVLTGAGFNGLAWGVHYSQVPPDACVPITMRALTIGDAVALVHDLPKYKADGTLDVSTKFEDWGALVAFASGVVDHFPTTYKVLKSSKSQKTTVDAVTTACKEAINQSHTGAGDPFGLAIVRTRL